MRKKKIEAQPIRKAKNYGLRAAVQIFEDILIVDCYDDKKYLARYAITETGEHCIYKDGKWNNKSIIRAFGFKEYYSSYKFTSKVRFDTKKDRDTVSYFTKIRKYDDDSIVLSEITSLERQYGMEVRENAYQRKVRRIDELMDEVPPAPDDFEEWIDEKIYKSSAYWFYDKQKNIYVCTACGKTHKKKNGRHNEEVTCSRTGRKCVIKKRNENGILEQDRAILIQKLSYSGRRVARHFRTYKYSYTSGATETKTYEDVRIIFGEYSIYKHRKPVQIFYGQYSNADEFQQDWWNTNPKNKRMAAGYLYPDVNLDGTEFEHLGIEQIAEKGWHTDVNKIMRSEWRPFEYLVKQNMEKLVNDIAYYVCNWSGAILCNQTLMITGKNVKEICRIDGQRWSRLKQMNGGITELQWLQLEQESEYKIRDETIRFFGENKIKAKDIEPLLPYLSIEKIKNHLAKQKEKPDKALDYWLDYLDMAAKAGYNLDDEIVYKPKDIKYRHDEMVDMLNRANSKEEVKRIENQFKNIRNVIRKTKKIYEYRNDKYAFIMPRSVEDIIVEGKNLHICVSTTDRYYERVNNEETYIGFIRDIVHPDISYYTIEFEPNGTVRQKRSEYNRQPNLPEITQFLKEWQKHLNLNDKIKEKQKKSEILRIEGLEELRRNSPDFARTLENDLLVV